MPPRASRLIRAKICPPLGPADGPASAASAACRSSGLSGSESRSLPRRIITEHFLAQKCALAALSDKTERRRVYGLNRFCRAGCAAETETGESFYSPVGGHGCCHPVDKFLAVASQPLCFSF